MHYCVCKFILIYCLLILFLSCYVNKNMLKEVNNLCSITNLGLLI
jgi:hypothetical protein